MSNNAKKAFKLGPAHIRGSSVTIVFTNEICDSPMRQSGRFLSPHLPESQKLV